MASEYSLKLKATLDTTEVQQELSKLRSQAGSAPASGQQSAGSMQNLSGLGTTLTRLSTTLTQLNQTLSRLNMQQKAIQGIAARQQSMPMGRSQYIMPLAYAPQRGAQAQVLPQFKAPTTISPAVNAIIQSKAARAQIAELWPSLYGKTQSEAAIKMDLDPYGHIASTLSKAGVKTAAEQGAAVLNAMHDLRGRTAAEWQRNVDNYLAQQMGAQEQAMRDNAQLQLIQNNANRKAARAPSLLSRRGARWGALGLAAIGTEVMSGLADLNEARGNAEKAKAYSAGASIVGKTTAYAAGGFMVGGPAGALAGGAIGFVAGGVETAFKYAADSAKNLADELKSAAQAVKRGAAVDKALADQQTQLQQHRVLKSGDLGKMRSVLNNLEYEREIQLASMAEVNAEGGLEKYAKKTENLIKNSEGASAEYEKEIKRRNKVAEEYEKQADELIKLNSSIETFKNALDDAKRNLAEEGALAEEAEITALTRQQEQIEAGRRGLREYGILQKDRDQIFYKSQSGVQSSLDQAQKAALEARARYESKLDEAERAPDSQLRAGLLQDAQEAMRDWQFQQSRADTLNEAMRDLKVNDLQEALSKLAAPDMSSTNSLASSGLMVNKSDDSARLESMTNYEETQVELQRQIKEILETKTFAAAAG